MSPAAEDSVLYEALTRLVARAARQADAMSAPVPLPQPSSVDPSPCRPDEAASAAAGSQGLLCGY